MHSVGILMKPVNPGFKTSSKLRRALRTVLSFRHQEIYDIVKEKNGITEDIVTHSTQDYITVQETLKHLKIAGIIYSKILNDEELWYSKGDS